MKDNQAKYPQLRFKCFTDPWEQRKFKDFITKSGKKNTKNENCPAYSVSNKLGLVSQADQFDGGRLDSLDKTAYKFVYKNEFAYNPARVNVGSIAFNNLDKTVIVSSLYVVLKMSEKLDNEYVLQFIKSPKFIEEVKRNTEGSVREYLFFDNFKNIRFPYTKNIEEQIKIGLFFKQLDDTITLHRRKLAKLKKLKQGYLQKMFPKNGSKFPQLRFAGFADAWKQRNIKEISKVFIGLVTSMTENYRDNGTLLIRNSDIKSGHFEFSKDPIYLDEVFAERNASRRLKIGDVITVHTGDIGTSAVVGKREEGSIGFATINTRPDKSVLDSDYLSTYFNTTVHKHWAIKMSTGDGRSNYNLYDFNRLIVPLPNIEEQQKIGTFFKQLDDTITLHQRKLEKLQELKKGYLQKMFC